VRTDSDVIRIDSVWPSEHQSGPGPRVCGFDGSVGNGTGTTIVAACQESLEKYVYHEKAMRLPGVQQYGGRSGAGLTLAETSVAATLQILTLSATRLAPVVAARARTDDGGRPIISRQWVDHYR